MTENPYAAPSAAVLEASADDPAGAFTGQPHRRPVGHATDWIAAGWRSFVAAPGPWVAIALVYFLMTLVSAFIPFAQYLVMPMLIGGVMLGCHYAARGEPITVAILFHGFNHNAGQLLVVGLIYLVATIAITLVLLIPLGAGMFFSGILTNPQALADMNTMLWVALIVLAALACAIPMMMAVWFAPALVIINDMNAFDAIKASFAGCLKNFLPFLWYGVVTLGLSIIATLPIMLGWLVVGPIMLVSVYESYRDIYYEPAS